MVTSSISNLFYSNHFLFLIVRHKVKEIVEFIQDDDRLRDERKKAKANRDKYVGVGSDTSSRYSSICHLILFINLMIFIKVIVGMIMTNPIMEIVVLVQQEKKILLN